jgi:polar amino acid transport system substrate-binding protein
MRVLPSHSRRYVSGLVLAALVAVALAAGACSTTASVRQTSVNSPAVLPADASVVHPTATPAPPSNCTASDPPPSPMPTPGHMPASSWMAHIYARGYLIAGVDQNTYLWAYRDPVTGQLQGFDIDMLEQINQAIFGANAPPIRFQIVANDDRSQAVATGKVDIVAETMTINCERQTRSSADPYPVDFSTVYYMAAEQLLVPLGSTITGPADLGHRRVCAAGGADSLGNLVAQTGAQHVVAWNVNDWADCLVMLQQGQVDAISTDNAILLGLHAQDPNTVIVGPQFSPEPYGMAISEQHPEFTAFVNGVLAQERADGTWEALYNSVLRPYTGQPQAPPAPTYKAAT